MDEARISNYVDSLLESWAVYPEGQERVVWQVLHDLLTAWARYELMDSEQQQIVTALVKKLQHHFETKCVLKERKRKTTKEKFPLKPLLKEKEKKEIEKNNTHTVCDADSGFDEEQLKRLEVFKTKCERYVGKYGREMVDNFIRYWTLPNQTTGRMRFEEKPYWSLGPMLESWQENGNTKNDATAALRLQKVRGKQAKEQVVADRQQSEAQERERANAELERRIEESKAGAVSREEWLAMKAAGAERKEVSHEGHDT